jgi:hypothetical protein
VAAKLLAPVDPNPEEPRAMDATARIATPLWVRTALSVAWFVAGAALS